MRLTLYQQFHHSLRQKTEDINHEGILKPQRENPVDSGICFVSDPYYDASYLDSFLKTKSAHFG